MSRPPRFGTAAKPVTIRATADERAAWEHAQKQEACPSLSAWIVKTLNARASIWPGDRPGSSKRSKGIRK